LQEGCPEEWVPVERTVRELSYLAALETLAAQARAQRNLTDAVRFLRLLIAADPLREESQCALMQALADCGDFAAVTQVYRDLRRLLHRELNAAPAPDTEALYKRLKVQAQGPSLLAKQPLPPRFALARRLPVPLTSLIGREQQIEEVAAWRERRLAYFLALVEAAEPHLTGAGQPEWFGRLETELDNLRAALEWSGLEPGSAAAGLRLACAIWRSGRSTAISQKAGSSWRAF
jgi:hypothetical protein